jgi:hypothetical protein
VPLFLSSAEWLVLLDRAAPRRFFGSAREEDDFVTLLNGGDCLASLLPDEDEEHPPHPSSASSSASSAAADAATGRRRVKERRQKLPPRRHLLTYQRFLPLLESLRELRGVSKEARALPASTVYREFYSFIRGSAGAMASPLGQLSRAEYCALATKMTAVGVEQRELIYDLYEQFDRRKRQLHLYDTMDVLRHLHAQQRQAGAERPRHSPLHRMLIDECQDLTQAELALLLEVAHDKDALYLCGDAAQTISRGVGFRFADVRTLFHAHSERGEAAMPALRSLTINYRTHAGIVDCAAAVVELLARLFPTTLDRLEPERGHFPGPPPALLPETDPASLQETLLGADELGLGEMGANQVVLVRSEAAKARLPAFLLAGLVLTVEESKGLEFDDVCT